MSDELVLAENPVDAFQEWMKAAVEAKCVEPTAMTLATSSKNGVPAARMVLFKGLKGEAFRFFTNYTSPKSHDLIANPQAALVFFWAPLQRQIRIVGPVEKLSEKESLEYFHSRARGSQIGAWSSPQSQKVGSRAELEKIVSENEEKFEGQIVPLPPFWGGFALTPESMEFWEGRDFRVHERFVFKKVNQSWVKFRLAP
jgi:pyridoxamine 5'-phosphate oxidase